MKGSIKFLAAASFLIISLALLLTSALGIYPAGPGWFKKKPVIMGTGPSSSPAAQINADESQTIRMSTGDVTISSKVDEAKLGVPIYPGAEKQGSGTVVFSDPGSGSEEIAGARFTTSDAFEKVLHFYKSQSPKAHVDETETDTQTTAVLSLTTTDGFDTLGIYIIHKKEAAKTEIAIHRGVARPGAGAVSSN